MPRPQHRPGVVPAADGEALRSHLFGIRWPLLFQASPTPPSRNPVDYDADTTPVQFIWRIIFAARRFTIPAAFLLGLSQVAGALLPVAAGTAVDSGIATGNTGQLVLWCAVVIALVVVNSMATRYGSRCGMYGMQTVQHRLRMTVTERLLHPAGMKNRTLGGAQLAVATGDVFRVCATMQLGVYPVGELVAIAAGGIVLFTIAWPLGLAVLIGAPLMMWIMAVAGRPMQRRNKQQQARVAAATGQAADLITGYRTIKGLRAEENSTARYITVSQEALQGALTLQNSRGIYFASMNVVSGCLVAGLAVGATAMALDGQLSVGELIAVVGVTQFMMGPLAGLPRSIGAVWATGVASASRVLDLLNTPYDVPPRHGDAQPPADLGITAVDITVNPGERVGIRASGAPAREFVAHLASGDEGVVLHGDGQTVTAADVPLELYRRSVLVTPHAADIFDGTVTDNLAPSAASPAAMQHALVAASCTDILTALPDGADSRVGESGTRLSGGQRQRIALARALAVEAPVLVLHDPTTAVDAITEHHIAEGIAGMRAGRTTLIVTESATLLNSCDRVVTL